MGGEAAMVVQKIENFCGWRTDLNLRLEVALEQPLIVHVHFPSPLGMT